MLKNNYNNVIKISTAVQKRVHPNVFSVLWCVKVPLIVFRNEAAKVCFWYQILELWKDGCCSDGKSKGSIDSEA